MKPNLCGRADLALSRPLKKSVQGRKSVISGVPHPLPWFKKSLVGCSERSAFVDVCKHGLFQRPVKAKATYLGRKPPATEHLHMKLGLLALSVCVSLIATSARAVDGKTVVQRCNHAYMQSVKAQSKVNEQDAAWCYGYITSLIDATKAYQSMINVAPPFCFREKPDMSVMLLAIVGIGPSDPPSLERNGSEMLINVFRSLYPCAK